MRRGRATTFLLAAVITSACTESSDTRQTGEPAETAAPAPTPEVVEIPIRNAYFGDLHVHTTYSFDAFIFGTRATPDDAYKFAKGGALTHPAGFEMKLSAPLDFEAVTDHGIYLGMLPAMFDASSSVGNHPISVGMREATTAAERRRAFNEMVSRIRSRAPDDLYDVEITKAAWADIVAAAERNNDPGHFTTFIGYEFTSSGPARENLHRNVIYRGSEAPERPYTALDSPDGNPEDLWAWMDAERAAGRELLAIPHNSNGSNGWMFQPSTFDGEPFTPEYAEQRGRNEPLVEITQIKGTSETHPALSPNDEWANFEIMPLRVASTLRSQPDGSYVRQALRRGIGFEQREGFNPFKFGFIGSSDTHNAAGSFDEYNYWSKVGMTDATPQLRGSVPLDEPGPNGEVYADSYFHYWGASGLAGVWADANTREAIYDAFRRRETFATSGPRIRVRFFAGYGFPDDLPQRADGIEQAYAAGVPMGGELLAGGGQVPDFYVWASRAPDSAPLQRLQIVKGWVTEDDTAEKVFDVACAGGVSPDPTDHRCPDNGASVDIETCEFSADTGAAELLTLWRDPEFDPGQRAFYYVRVLENPTCRWSTWDAIRAGVPPREDLPATIQERAWSSPIWYEP